jgi:hypothetical protein
MLPPPLGLFFPIHLLARFWVRIAKRRVDLESQQGSAQRRLASTTCFGLVFSKSACWPDFGFVAQTARLSQKTQRHSPGGAWLLPPALGSFFRIRWLAKFGFVAQMAH